MYYVIQNNSAEQPQMQRAECPWCGSIFDYDEEEINDEGLITCPCCGEVGYEADFDN